MALLPWSAMYKFAVAWSINKPAGALNDEFDPVPLVLPVLAYKEVLLRLGSIM
jgi:hypothetical protein